MGEISYEILIQKGGRWEIDKRYGRTGRRSALERAKSLEGHGGVTAVKVIKEESDDDGDTNETTIFNSAGGSGGGKAGAGPGRMPQPVPSRPERSAPRKTPAKKKKQKKKAEHTAEEEEARAEGRAKYNKLEKQAFGLIGKILAVTLTGMIAAVSLTWALSAVINNIDMNTLAKRAPELADLLGGQSRPMILIAIFAGTFLLIALPFTIRLMRRASAQSRANKQQEEEFGTKMLDQVLEEEAAGKSGPKPKTGASAKDIMEMTGGDADGDGEPKAEKEKKKGGIETFDEEWGLTNEDKKKKQDEDNEIEVRGLPPLAQQARGKFMQFVGASLQEVKNAEVPLNAHNRLGCCLFMAGACEILGRDHDLDPHFVQVMVTENVRILGIEGDQALDFGKNYQGYLLNNPQYLDLFNRGREAMTIYLSDDPAKARKELLKSLQGWGDLEIPEGAVVPITIMVSDVPGTTKMTLNQGQVHVEDVIQAHGRMVGDALARWGGREVQRTTSAIVAAFTTAEQAVEAASQLQMAAVAHNHEKTQLQVPVRIALYTGTATTDDPGQINAALQMAARIAERGLAGQVLASTSVVNGCEGKPLHFGERGAVQLRDMEEPVPLHEVLWNREMEIREDTMTPEEKATRIAEYDNAIEAAAAERPPGDEPEETAAADDGAPPQPTTPQQPTAPAQAAPDAPMPPTNIDENV